MVKNRQLRHDITWKSPQRVGFTDTCSVALWLVVIIVATWIISDIFRVVTTNNTGQNVSLFVYLRRESRLKWTVDLLFPGRLNAQWQTNSRVKGRFIGN